MDAPKKHPIHTKPLTADSPVHTYHCLCTNLLFASTTPLSALPQRALSSSLDKAHILPLPSSPPSSATSSGTTSKHFALPISMVPAKKPLIVKGNNGFEKRWLMRCGRCSLVVGYGLDWGQFEEGKEYSGRREDVVYLLPQGFLSTAEMIEGKDVRREIGFEGVGVSA